MTSLIKYDAMCLAIAEAHAIDEIKDLRDKAIALQIYARQAKNREAEQKCTEIRIRAERRLGEMLREQKDTVGLNRGLAGSVVSGTEREPVKDTRPTLASVGIDKKLSSSSQKLAAIPQDEFEKVLENLESLSVSSLLKSHVSHNSGNNEWYTPAVILDLVRIFFGEIDCDPASSSVANLTVLAKTFYSLAEDGLSKKWFGRVWLNPPYGSPFISQFCQRASQKFQEGEIEEILVLVNNATETEWFGFLLSTAAAICFPRGRIRYSSPDRESVNSPLQGQALVYMGKNRERFSSIFKELGFILWTP